MLQYFAASSTCFLLFPRALIYSAGLSCLAFSGLRQIKNREVILSWLLKIGEAAEEFVSQGCHSHDKVL